MPLWPWLKVPNHRCRYLFDLRGYSVLPNALPDDDIRAINDWIDDLELEKRPVGDWEGDVEIHSYCASSVSVQGSNASYASGRPLERIG
eukprot:COSAG02_NODE_7606_length_2936_cov_5.615791_5_plen_89_part_00